MLRKSILVMDETNNYQLWELIQKITWFLILLARNKVFIATNHQPRQANKRKSSLEIVRKLCLENRCLMTWFNPTLTSTISPSIVAKDKDSCGEFII